MDKRKRKICWVSGLVLILSGFLMIVSSASLFAASDKPIILKLGHGSPFGDARDKGANRFAELIQQKTGGKVKVDVFHSASLGSDEDVLEQLQLGSTAFGAPGAGTVAKLQPALNVVEMPFLMDTWEQAWALLDGPIGKELTKDLPAKGIRVLSFWENGFRNITNSKRPIEKPSDLEGIKIRVPNWEMSVATFKALGAAVTPMAWPEVYLALQQGVVDAQENPLTIAWGAKFYEVQKYVSMTGHQYSPLPLIMSEKIWKDLAPEFQKAIEQAAAEAGAYQRQLTVENENNLLQKFLEKGMKANTPNKEPFRKAVKVVYDKYQDKFGTWIKKCEDANREWKAKHPGK